MTTKSAVIDFKNFIKRPKLLNPIEPPRPRRTKKRKYAENKTVYLKGLQTNFPKIFPRKRLSRKSNSTKLAHDVDNINDDGEQNDGITLASSQTLEDEDDFEQSDISNKMPSSSPTKGGNREDEYSQSGIGEVYDLSETNEDKKENETHLPQYSAINEIYEKERSTSNNPNETATEITEEGFAKEYEYRPYGQRRGKTFEEMDEDERFNFLRFHYHMSPEQIKELTFQPKVNEKKIIHKTYTGIDTHEWQESPDYARAEAERRLKPKIRNRERKVSVVPSHQRKNFMLSRLQGSVYYNMKEIYESSPRDISEKRFYDRLSKVKSEEKKRQSEMLKAKERRRKESIIRQRNQLKFVRDKYEQDAWKRFMTQYVTSKVMESDHLSRRQYGLPETLDMDSNEERITQKAPVKRSKEASDKRKFDPLFKMTLRPVWKADDDLKFEGFDAVYLEKENGNGEIEKQRLIVRDIIKEATGMLLHKTEKFADDTKKNKKRSVAQNSMTDSQTGSRNSCLETGLALSERTSRNRSTHAPPKKQHSCPAIKAEDKTTDWLINTQSNDYLNKKGRTVNNQNNNLEEKKSGKNNNVQISGSSNTNEPNNELRLELPEFDSNSSDKLNVSETECTSATQENDKSQNQENRTVQIHVKDSNESVKKRNNGPVSDTNRSREKSNYPKSTHNINPNNMVKNSRYSYDSFSNTKVTKQLGIRDDATKDFKPSKLQIRDYQQNKQIHSKEKQNQIVDKFARQNDTNLTSDITRIKHNNGGKKDNKAHFSVPSDMSKSDQIKEKLTVEKDTAQNNRVRNSIVENGAAIPRKFDNRSSMANIKTPNKTSPKISVTKQTEEKEVDIVGYRTSDIVNDRKRNSRIENGVAPPRKVNNKSSFANSKTLNKNVSNTSVTKQTEEKETDVVIHRGNDKANGDEQSISPTETERKVQWKDLVNKYLRQPVPVIGKTVDRLTLETNYDSDDDSDVDIFERAIRRHNLNLDDDDDDDTDDE